jgi:hypothetical protein
MKSSPSRLIILAVGIVTGVTAYTLLSLKREPAQAGSIDLAEITGDTLSNAGAALTCSFISNEKTFLFADGEKKMAYLAPDRKILSLKLEDGKMSAMFDDPSPLQFDKYQADVTPIGTVESGEGGSSGPASLKVTKGPVEKTLTGTWMCSG